MKKNIILVIVIILLCCGCTADYTVSINEDLSVNESMTALEDEEFFKQYDKSSVQRVIGFLLKPNLDYLNSNGFKITQLFNSNTAGVKIENSYKSIDDYKKISKIIDQFADEFEYTVDGNKVTIKIVGKFNADEQDQEVDKYLVENGKINIKLPHKVYEHNADSVDKDKGIYTWNIKEAGVEREILLVFDKNIRKDLIYYIVIGGIIVVIGIIEVVIYKGILDNKSRNKL